MKNSNKKSHKNGAKKINRTNNNETSGGGQVEQKRWWQCRKLWPRPMGVTGRQQDNFSPQFFGMHHGHRCTLKSWGENLHWTHINKKYGRWTILKKPPDDENVRLVNMSNGGGFLADGPAATGDVRWGAEGSKWTSSRLRPSLCGLPKSTSLAIIPPPPEWKAGVPVNTQRSLMARSAGALLLLKLQLFWLINWFHSDQIL